jgi:PTS system nitrogen regulatory IIA component
MKISDILQEPMVVAELTASDKEGLLDEMAVHMCGHVDALNGARESVKSALLGRERLGSTGVGESVAIPHAKIPGLKALTAGFGRSPKGVAFEAVDQQPVRLVFVLLVPENSAGAHLKALARIARLLKSSSFRDHLMSLPDAHAIYQAFLDEDSKY